MALDVRTATRYIAVAAPGQIIIDEWKKKDPTRVFVPVPKDYALMKVLHTLRKSSRAFGIHVNSFQVTDPVTPLNFSGLRDSDFIFIAGHGNPSGLYALGHDADIGMDRLVHILTGDGNLKKRREGKKVTIVLLSCRAGLGFHKALAFRLSQELSLDVTVGGPQGFTFGSIKTSTTACNEVLIRGIPWDMEYRGSIPRTEAEEVTSAREGKTITIAGKQTEITRFLNVKTDLEKAMKDVVARLQATELNAALIELDLRFGFRRWGPLLEAQYALYSKAKEQSALEFDMWFGHVPDGYVWTDGRNTTEAEVNAILAVDPVPVGDGYTSTR